MTSEIGATVDYEASRRYHQQREQRRRAEQEAERQQWLDRTRAAIREIAPRHPTIERVYLFGSLMQPGRFRSTNERWGSDIDVAIEGPIEAETPFASELEFALKRFVDVRPFVPPIIQAIEQYGEQIYERKTVSSEAQH